MKKLFATVAITMLGSTLAFAQTSGGVNAGGNVGVNAGTNGVGVNAGAGAGAGANGSTNGGNSNNTNGTNANGNNANGSNANGTNANGTTDANGTNANNGQATRRDSDECKKISTKVHSGEGDFTPSEAAPYMDKMTAMKMSPKTKGKFTAEDFMAACEAGAFDGM